MKIAIFHELDKGGARKIITEFSKHLIENNTVDLYTVTEKISDEEGKYFRKKYNFNLPEQKNGWLNRIYNDSIFLFKLYLLHKQIAKIIDRGKYDFVFVNPSKYTQAPFILRFLKTKKVYYAQEPLRVVYEPLFQIDRHLNLFKKNYAKFNRFIKKIIDKSNISKANNIITNSNFTKENLRKIYKINAKVCYLGVDSNYYIPSENKKTTDIIFFGTKTKEDGYDLFLKAIGKIKPGPKIIYLGDRKKWVSEKNILENYHKTKILVNLEYRHPFGLVPLETMACGIPIIVLNEGGYKETVVQGKTGFLINRDSDELYSKILILMNNTKLRKKMGQAAREHVLKNFRSDKSVSNFLNIARTII